MSEAQAKKGSAQKTKKEDFTRADRLRCLLWCNRYCCFCGEFSGTSIELGHIKAKTRGGKSVIDNAIPVCPNCHAEIDTYSIGHGNQYRYEELKAQRNQVYEKHTRHLVPPIQFEITQDKTEPSIIIDKEGNPLLIEHEQYKLPKAGSRMMHRGDYLPVKVLVQLRIVINGEDLGMHKSPFYCGKRPWNMNPRTTTYGNLTLTMLDKKTKKVAIDENSDLKALVRLIILDQYEMPHVLLPSEWYPKYYTGRDGKQRIQWVQQPSPSIKVREWQRPIKIDGFL